MPVKKVLSKEQYPEMKKPAKIWTDNIDQGSIDQIRLMGSLPFVFKHLAIMPDVHAGKGSTIGTVIATQNAILPAAVGVDLGCGMSAYKLGSIKKDLSASAKEKIRIAIEKAVPTGFSVHGQKQYGIESLTEDELSGLKSGAKGVRERALQVTKDNHLERGVNKMGAQAGTLGGGNHFIEVCVSKNNELWLMLHSGSRGVGNLLAQYHIGVAKGLMKKAFIDLPNDDLAYLWKESAEFDHYLADMQWAQHFAYLNRRAMGRLVLKAINPILRENEATSVVVDPFTDGFIDCHHNYVAIENHYGANVYVTRKGAVEARKGSMGIIPGSMGAKSFVVRGRGNEESFCSCSHGAGRVMSRTQAKKTFTKEDLEEQTVGIECRKDEDVIDEIPGAYKDIEKVMEDQSDLVDIVEELRQIICVKG